LRILIVLISGGLFAYSVGAAELRRLEVQKNGPTIAVEAELVIEAPTPQVFDALADYNEFADLSSAYLESRYLEPDVDGTPRIYTKIRGCILFFCRTIARVARLDTVPYQQITATAEPALSDVDYGVEKWVLHQHEAGTVLIYTHVVEPDFWVPPVLGPWALRRSLRSDALSAAEHIESLAGIKP
jgi:hypothetical protein